MSLPLFISFFLSRSLALSLSFSVYLYLSLSLAFFSSLFSLLLFSPPLRLPLFRFPPTNASRIPPQTSFIVHYSSSPPIPTPYSPLLTPHSTHHSPLPTPHTQFPISLVVGRYGHRMIYDACMSIFDDLLKGNPSTLLDEPDPALPTTGPFKKTSHKVGKTCVRQHPYHYSCTWVGLLHRILRLTYIYFIFLILQHTL